MVREVLKLSSNRLGARIRKLQAEQIRVMELFNLGGISRDIANIELFKLYKKIEFALKLYSFCTTLRVKAQSHLLSID